MDWLARVSKLRSMLLRDVVPNGGKVGQLDCRFRSSFIHLDLLVSYLCGSSLWHDSNMKKDSRCVELTHKVSYDKDRAVTLSHAILAVSWNRIKTQLIMSSENMNRLAVMCRMAVHRESCWKQELLPSYKVFHAVVAVSRIENTSISTSTNGHTWVTTAEWTSEPTIKQISPHGMSRMLSNFM